jgi:hypothetical protein
MHEIRGQQGRAVNMRGKLRFVSVEYDEAFAPIWHRSGEPAFPRGGRLGRVSLRP